MSKTLLQENETMAVARYVRMGPNKVRRVLRQITGKSYSEALLLLEFLPYKSCDPIIKVLRSAVANAKNNLGYDTTKLVVKKAFADQGPVMKRFRPRAQGSANKCACFACAVLLSFLGCPSRRVTGSIPRRFGCTARHAGILSSTRCLARDRDSDSCRAANRLL